MVPNAGVQNRHASKESIQKFISILKGGISIKMTEYNECQ